MPGRKEETALEMGDTTRKEPKKESNPELKALQLAVKENNQEEAKELLQNGADPTKYWNGTTALELAIQRRNKEMVLVLVDNGKPKGETWEVYKDRFKNIKGSTKTFANLVTELPDLAETLLDQCITTKLSPHEEDYEINFDCSLLENKTSKVNKCLRGLPYTCCCDDIDQTSNFDDEYGDVEYDAYEKHHHPLYRVMLSDNPGLLKHPVVLALLEKKLYPLGWLLYYSNLLLYIVLVSLLTAFLLILPNPQEPDCVQLQELEGNNSLSEAENTSLSEAENSTMCSMGMDSRIAALTGIKTIALALTILRLILELYQLYSRKVAGYFNDWVNWFELAEYISTIIFLFSADECFCLQPWQWELGVVSLALSWVVLIAWLQAMHWLGIYVTMMIKIIVSFAYVAIFGVFLVVGFGLTFYLLFYQPPQVENMNVPSPFSSPLRAILSAILLTAGEYDTGGVFYSDSADSPSPGSQYESLAFIIWLAGIIIMSVLFNNLLVGLAVGEVNSVRDEAENTTIKQRIELVLTQEEQFPEFIHRRRILTEPIITVNPNKVNKYIACPKGFLLIACGICSFLCYNISHIRYWFNSSNKVFIKQSTKYLNIPELIEKTKQNNEVEIMEGEDTPVSKQDLQVMQDRLNKQMTAMQDILLREIRKQ